MSDAAALPAAADEPHWQRLHPATLALALVRIGPRSLQFLPAVAALGFTGNWVWIVPAILAYLLIALAAACLQWMRFRFIVGDDAVVIESGVLSRQHRTIPFDRIQDVSIEQGLVSRALGIAKVGFETGAGGFGCFLDVVEQDRGFLLDLCHALEPRLARVAGVLADADQDAIRVFQNAAVWKKERAIALEALNQDDVLAGVGVAGVAPFHFFEEAGSETDFAELILLWFEVLGLLEIPIHLVIWFAGHHS